MSCLLRCFAIYALLVGACTSNVVLRRPPAFDTGPLGVFQRCSAGESACANDPVYDSSRLNASHTRFFQLPDCPYGIHDIAVLNSGSVDAQVLIRCAAPPPVSIAAGGELPVTAAGGGMHP